MKLVIPVAGKGTRLRPHTLTTPKALITLAGKPIIGHVLAPLEDLGITEVILVMSPGMEEVADYIKRHYKGYKVHTVLQSLPLGLGHAFYITKDFFEDGEPILGILGDTLAYGDFKRYIDKSLDFVAVKEVENPRNYGIVELDNNGNIISFVEKPDTPVSNLAVIGFYFISDSSLLFDALSYIIENNIKTKEEFQLTDALSVMTERGWHPRGAKVDEWYDMGSVSSLLKTHRFLLKRRGEIPPKSSEIVQPVYIEETVEIIDSHIGPFVTIERYSKVESSELKDCIIHRNVIVRNSRLENSIIGSNSKVINFYGSINLGAFGKIEGRDTPDCSFSEYDASADEIKFRT